MLELCRAIQMPSPLVVVPSTPWFPKMRTWSAIVIDTGGVLGLKAPVLAPMPPPLRWAMF